MNAAELGVLADQLQERQDPLGEYLAGSLRLEAMHAGDPARWALEQRLEELWLQHETRWSAAAHAHNARAASVPVALRRGVVAHADIVRGHRVREQWESATRAFDITSLDVRYVESGMEWLFSGEHAERIDALTTPNGSLPAAFGAASRLRALTSLKLRGTGELPVHPSWRTLERLDLHATGEQSRGALEKAHVAAPALRELSVRLGRDRIAALGVLAGWPLERLLLDLRAFPTDPAWLLALASSPLPLQVGELALENTGLAAPAFSKRWPRLARLAVRTPDAIDAIEPLSSQLEVLDLSGSFFSPHNALRLSALQLPRLRSLDLHAWQLGLEDCARFAASPWAAQVEALDLSRTVGGFEREQLGNVLGVPGAFPRLRVLRVDVGTAEGVHALLREGAFPALEELELGAPRPHVLAALAERYLACGLRFRRLALGRPTRAELERLAAAPNARALRRLELHELGDDAVAGLEAVLGLDGLDSVVLHRPRVADPRALARFGAKLRLSA